MSNGWSDFELSSCVNAYMDISLAQLAGGRVVKKKIYQQISSSIGRSDKSVELRMQNISAVLAGLGKQWSKGLTPAANVGRNVTNRLAKLLEEHQAFSALPPLQAVSYKLKLPAMRHWLIQVAKQKATVAYSDVMSVFDVDRFSLRHAMDILGHESEELGEPIITALIVGKNSGRCSAGLQKEFGVEDDNLERQKLYAYWETHDDEPSLPLPISAPLDLKTARFVSVEARPQQATFRGRVFKAFEGCCAISGCSVGNALDAAHIEGRMWRLGHNDAKDGILLRKDLHALYDAGLLTIQSDGCVQLDSSLIAHYGTFAGRKVTFAE